MLNLRETDFSAFREFSSSSFFSLAATFSAPYLASSSEKVIYAERKGRGLRNRSQVLLRSLVFFPTFSSLVFNFVFSLYFIVFKYYYNFQSRFQLSFPGSFSSSFSIPFSVSLSVSQSVACRVRERRSRSEPCWRDLTSRYGITRSSLAAPRTAHRHQVRAFHDMIG